MTQPPAGPGSPGPSSPGPGSYTLKAEQTPEVVSVWVNRVVVVVLLAAAFAFVAIRVGWMPGTIGLPHVFWLLAVVPGLAGIVHYFVAEIPRHARRASAVEGWLRSLRQAVGEQTAAAEPGTQPYASSSRRLIDAYLSGDSQDTRLRFSYILFGAVALTAVFGLVAEFSLRPEGIGVPPQPYAAEGPGPFAPRQGPTPASPASPAPQAPSSSPRGPSPAPSGSVAPTSPASRTLSTPQAPAATPLPTSSPSPSPTPSPAPSPTPSPTPSSAPSPAPGVATATPAVSGSSTPAPPATPPAGGGQTPPLDSNTSGGYSDAILGLVFAGYGAYVWAVQILVGRINSGSVTGRFLVRLSLQCAAALVIGAVAGQTRLALALGSPNQALFFYFIVGLFPGWARTALRRRASAILTPDETGCGTLPLCLVDGLDEDIADRLWEQGMNDVQHLATADPVDLMLRTNYSPKRVLDWIDQAILIQYVRGKIAIFRGMGVRGAIDLCVLYGRAYATTAPPPPQDREVKDASETLDALATKADMNRAALARIAAALSEDDNVRFVWLLWQNRLP